MANRHLSRSLVLQSLFEWDFYDGKKRAAERILERNLAEFAPGLDDIGFARTLVRGTLGERKNIDAIIEKAAPEWPLKQIAFIDRNILRIGLFELLFGNRKEVPPKVAINEAIELSKTFGSDTSSRFVNGVLGTVYREIGEPGKDEGKKRQAPLDLASLPREQLAGAVVWQMTKSGQYRLALVHDVFGYWTLSKGRLEKDEDEQKGACRKLKQELGLTDVEIGEELGRNEYIAADPKRGPIRRNVVYFLAHTNSGDLKLEEKAGLDDARWFRKDELDGLRMYDDIRPLLERAMVALESPKQ